MARNAGPTGSGLIPPASGSRNNDDTGDDLDQNDLPPVEEDIDGIPPIDGDDDDDLDENSGDDVDIDEIEARITARLEQTFQTRFDRAVSKTRRSLERQYSVRKPVPVDSDEDDDDDDEEDSPPPKKSKRRRTPAQTRNPDVTSIRLLARDMVSDEMASSGSAEKAIVKSVLDMVLPVVDWSVADEEDFVAELVEKLSGASTELVKTGSDRKVTQLRRMGVIPDRQGQPSSGQQGGKRSALEKAMQKGSAAAKERFPDGQRRLLR